MAYKSHNPLPEPASADAFVSIAPFDTCKMEFPASMCIAGFRGVVSPTSWRFFINHKPSNTKLWFDLGVAHDLTLYPPRIQQVQLKVFKAQAALTDPATDARSLGEDPDQVKYIIASHAHWDHMFPPASFFPHAKVLCGAGTLEFAKASWPSQPDGTFDGRIWDPKASELPVEEFPSPDAAPRMWQPLGPYKNAHDFLGDGSFWILDAPGHCPGNLAALARVKSFTGQAKWVFLGGDCFHCFHFVHHPEAPFGKGVKVTPTDTFHEDEEVARDFIRQTAELKKGEGADALIWIAHTDTLEGAWEVDAGLLKDEAVDGGRKMVNGH